MTFPRLTDPEFDREVTLRKAYRAMERFVSGYLARGDAPVSDSLHAYASEVADGGTTDPAAASDFLCAAGQVRSKGSDESP